MSDEPTPQAEPGQEANDNGPPTWEQQRHEQSYGTSPTPEPQTAAFDPGDHTVAEVEEYVAANPDQQAAVLKAEKAGKNRSTLVDSLEGVDILADLDALRAHLGTVSNVSNTVLESALEAGRAKVYAGPPRIKECYLLEAPVQMAVIFEASRYFRRRQSPEGVAGWGDLGVIRIASRDPDVDAMTAPYRDYCDAGVS